tara:strand:- start:2491 stop:2649 length:159 start_codon:yes stop_codon:yes gene_type:complete
MNLSLYYIIHDAFNILSLRSPKQKTMDIIKVKVFFSKIGIFEPLLIFDHEIY